MYYIEVETIPEPTRTQFIEWLRGKTVPIIEGKGLCAYLADWALFKARL